MTVATVIEHLRSTPLVVGVLLLLASSCASVPVVVPQAQLARYRELAQAIDARRSFNPHCWCNAYQGGLCGTVAVRELGLSAADIPLLRVLGGTDDYQVAAGVAELLATLGAPARDALVELIHRRDDVGSTLRIGISGDSLGRYEACARTGVIEPAPGAV